MAEVAGGIEGLNAAAMKKNQHEVEAAYQIIRSCVLDFIRAVNTKVPQELPPLSEL